MRKILFALLAFFLFVSSAFASVAVYDDGVYEGEATALDFTSTGVSVSFDGSTANVAVPSSFIALGMYNADVTVVETDPTVLSASWRAASVYITTRTLTLSNGTEGQIMFIIGRRLTDTGTLTLTASKKTGWYTITMDAVDDSVTLFYINDTYGWVVLSSNSVTINAN